MTPYYDQDGVTIYHGECGEVMESLRGHGGGRLFDLLLTDPPYGLGMGKASNRGGSGAAKTLTGFFAGQSRPASSDYGADSEWDRHQPRAVARARQLCEWQIIFGGNYYDLGPTRCFLVWDKDNGETDFADCELAWTNFDKAVRMLTYRWNGMLQAPGIPKEHREHPTQKPEAVMRWALQHAPSHVKTVFDPFMGSGTSLVAAKRLGKTTVGIEQEERYCEIAARRCSQGSLFAGLVHADE